MKIARRIVYFISVIDIVQSNLHREVHDDQSIREILRSVARQDVIIRLQERDMDDRMRNLLGVVSQAVVSAWPTQILASARLEAALRPSNAASSRTLLIYLYPSVKVLDYGQLNAVVQEVRLMSQPKHLPRLLLICAAHLGARTLSVLQQLRYLWHLQFFNAVVLEVSFSPEQSQPVFMGAHFYNGFTKSYTKLTSYDEGVDWYPDKPLNMYGARLQVMFKAAAPYGTLDLESGRLGGLAGASADVLSVAVNATVVQTRSLSESDLVYDALVLMHTDRYSTSYEHTVSIDYDRVCLLLPVLQRERISMNLTEVIFAAVIGMIITTIVWSALLSLTVGNRMSQPMIIISQILCIPPANGARTTLEKIIYVTIMLSTAEYANVFHAELFRFSVKYTDHMNVSNFKDLYETGLKILVPPIVYETIQTIGAGERLPSTFFERFQPSVGLEEDTRTLDTTKAYFMSEMNGKLAELTRVDGEGRRLFKLYDLCVMYLYRVHTLPVRSPYREEINRVLLMMGEHGLTKKHLDEFWERLGERRGRDRSKIIIRDYSKYIGIAAAFMGCLLSLVVFVGELIVGLVSARIHSPRASVAFTHYPEVDKGIRTIEDSDVKEFRGTMFKKYNPRVF